MAIDVELGDDEYEGVDTFFNIEDMADVPTAAINKKIPKDDLENIVKDEFKKETKALAEEKRKQRLALKREMQDETVKRNIQTKLDKRSAYDRRNQLRASAVSQRIQAYSIASSLGFAGYVAASIVDQFVIRPKEKQDIAAEDKYNADYAEYEQFQKADQLERRRTREDEISAMVVDEQSIRDNIFNSRPTGYKEKQAPSSSSIVKSTTIKDLDEDPKYTSRDRPVRSRSKEFLDTEEELDDYGVPIAKASSKDKGGETQKAVDTATRVAGAIKPVAPTSAVSFIEKNGPIGLAIAAGITAAQMGNQKIEEMGKGAATLGKDILTGSTTTGLATVARTARSTIDPLGINPIAQVSVTGFETLLSLAESIKSYTEKNKEFSPLTLQASVQGDIAKLMQSIELAQKNDPLKAQFTEVTTQLDLAWNEFKSEVFQNIAPTIIGILQVLVVSLQATEGSFSLAIQVIKNLPGIGGIIVKVLEAIAANTAPDPALQGNLFKEIQDFMNPNNNADLPAKAFRNRIPNQIP
jgi:hypothetical protein